MVGVKIPGNRDRVRSGFTVVELLVVMAIIAVLMTLTVKVVGSFVSQARASATETTIRKIDGLLAARAQAMHRLALRSGWLQTTPAWGYSAALTNDSNLQPIIARKIVAATFFPQRFAELSSPNAGVDAQLDMLYRDLRAAGAASNEEILYAFVTGANAINDTPGSDNFTTRETGTGPNGLPVFVDGWGKPLRFYRWPTRLMADSNAGIILATLPRPVNRDPDDPLRRCNTYANFVDTFHDPATFHAPIVVSAGPDGLFGLGDPDSSSTDRLAAILDIEQATDNLTFLKFR